MASALKRKRGPAEVLNTPKRAKSAKGSKNHVSLDHGQVGWDAAFQPQKKNELVRTNGVSKDGENPQRDLGSPEALDFDEFVQEGEVEQEKERNPAKPTRVSAFKKRADTWKLSEPIGGRMINAEPVFTIDEKFLIVANRSTIQVYSTSNSLLYRSIKLQIDSSLRPNSRIITYCLSPTQSNIVWVACSDGAIYSIDWTSGAGADQYWGISSTGCIHMTVASMESAGRRRDVVFTTEVRRDGGWRITANELAPPDGPIKTCARTIYTSTQRISFLKTAKEGSVIVAASGKRVLIGSLRSTEYDVVDKIRYEFRVFESTDFVSSLDLRVQDRMGTEELKKSILKRLPVVDVVVGDGKGSIFVHNDLLANLVRSGDGTVLPGINLIPRKLHWHRQAVHTVKWSLDGNYIISGGTETVLVLWQLDTGKKHFLPHMSATIQNVVVSPTGSSYGIQLADNSTMVLSTAELQPTTNIAGIQASVLDYEDSDAESRVLRVEEETHERPLVQRTPAVISPNNPSRLFLGVGQMHEISPTTPLIMSVPFLQTFDLGSASNVSRQGLTRSNITNVNIAPSAHRISEPRVTHMKISSDGNWLATIDEWRPPKHPVDLVGQQEMMNLEDEVQPRREVFLKFWQWSQENDTWELVSRVDSPHGSGGANRVLDLAADPSSLRFSTVGEDRIVRTWTTKTRKRDGVVVRGKGGIPFRNWSCQHAISLGKLELLDEYGNPRTGSAIAHGCVAFSEDGSIVAAACGGDQHNLVHLIDPDLGSIRLSHNGISGGDIVKVEFLGQDLIALSNKLSVYDLVLDEMKYSVKLGAFVSSLSIEQKMEMMHLAVDRKSRTFAVTLPGRFDGPSGTRLRKQSLLSLYSELAIFEQDKRQPVLQETFPTLVTALLPAVGSPGFIVLDTAAEIRTAVKKGSQVITNLAQSTSALLLDTVPEQVASDLSEVVGDSAEQEEGEEILSDAAAIPEEDDGDDDTPVVRQQQLSEIFDIGPAFALPPMEEMFYQVAGLFSSKPLAQSV